MQKPLFFFRPVSSGDVGCGDRGNVSCDSAYPAKSASDACEQARQPVAHEDVVARNQLPGTPPITTSSSCLLNDSPGI